VLDALPDLESARDDWTRLAERSDNVFSTWEWADTWWRHFGDGRELRLSVLRDDGGEVAAILPLHVATTRPLRVVRLVGYGPADELGPVCDPSTRGRAGAALREALDQDGGWSMFLADRFPAGDGWAGALGSWLLRSEACPVLPIEGRSFDDYLATKSKNFREQVRRRARKLEREHEVRFRLADAASFEDDFSALVRLHAARWDGPGAFEGPLEAFHRDFARFALERGWLRLWILEIAGAPAAAWYGLRFAGAESYYQAGRDPAYDQWSAGFVLLSHSIRQAFDDGMREYRFLLGDEPFKERFAERDDAVETLGAGRNAAGKLAVSAAAAVRRLPPGLRRRFVRAAG
jgi:CelD/BcsL family acetyltransferase involved in cellulose biosynthesis